ncbi:hypothetical protein JANAI62_37800 [Jannaschia pagri]|uniref:Uncharacterized protein n=2 Tax=Roseobacteraceae TaxID=2854170 RepID=A0ABQ4NS02_9RHOB|nr:hypothetical protein JANAI61_38160 [Jannaschia sp. AI_61]GIT97157.1 hypothetical protein JANAI62_37800 [Jannaschia sp. AI_62]
MMTKGNGPVDTFQDYPVEIAVFERQGENGTWHNAQVSKTYKEEDEYKRTSSFTRNDLLKLNALLPQAINRMQELAQEQREQPDKRPVQDMDTIRRDAQAHRARQAQRQGHEQGHEI